MFQNGCCWLCRRRVLFAFLGVVAGFFLVHLTVVGSRRGELTTRGLDHDEGQNQAWPDRNAVGYSIARDQDKIAGKIGSDDSANYQHVDGSDRSLNQSPSPRLPFTLEAISPSLINFTSVEFLPEYKNPCWKEPLADGNPFLRHNLFHDIYKKIQYSPEFRNAVRLVDETLKETDPDKRWRLRCLPYFYIVGLFKTGTTDLYDKLAEHPDVTRALFKEPHWWSHRRMGRPFYPQKSTARTVIPIGDYVDLFAPAAVEIQESQRNSMVTGEASVSTLWFNEKWQSQPGNHPNMTEPKYLSAHYLHAVQPDAKIIVSLRQPAERLWSDYLYYNYSNGRDRSKEQFHNFCAVAVSAMTKCIALRSLRGCVYDESFHKEYKVFLHLSMYYVYIRDWLEVFPRDQIFVSRLEDYVKDRVPVLNDICHFLGLSSLPKDTAARVKSSRVSNPRVSFNVAKGAMLKETRDLLDNFFEPYNKQLVELIGDDRFLWRDS